MQPSAITDRIDASKVIRIHTGDRAER